MIKGLEHLIYEEKLRGLGLCSLEKGKFTGISSTCRNTWREGAKRMEPGSFQWCPVTGPEATCTHWNTGDSLWTPGNTFLLWGWPSTCTGCSGRLKIFRRHLDMFLSNPGSKWPCFSRGIGQDDLQRSLTALTTLRFCVPSPFDTSASCTEQTGLPGSLEHRWLLWSSSALFLLDVLGG